MLKKGQSEFILSIKELRTMNGGKATGCCPIQGLDVWDAWSFFKLLDEDGGGEVEVEAGTRTTGPGT